MKRWISIGAVLLGLAFAGYWFFAEYRMRKWEAEWEAFVARWEAQGESFGVEGNLPPRLSDELEFAMHPWIRRVVEEEAEVRARLELMNPEWIEGYVDWVSSGDSDGRLPLMPVDLAERVRKHRDGFEEEIEAFGEALERPGCRIGSWDTGKQIYSMNRVIQLSSISGLLDASCHASMVLDDPAGFTRGVVLLLRAGEKLRGGNLAIGTVVGSGFEARATSALLDLPDSISWPSSQRMKWLAALNYRTRPLADEYAAVMRVERGNMLVLVDLAAEGLEKKSRVPSFLQLRRKTTSYWKLRFCETLQGMVLAQEGVLATRIDGDRIEHFEEYIYAEKAEEDLGAAVMWPLRGIYGALLLHEKDLELARLKMLDKD